MATCSHCDNQLFQVEEQTPEGSGYKLLFVQCASCGTPVGVLDYFNIGAMMEEQDVVMADLGNRLERIEVLLRTLTDSIDTLRKQARAF